MTNSPTSPVPVSVANPVQGQVTVVNPATSPVPVSVSNLVPVEPYTATLTFDQVPHTANGFTGSERALFVPSGKRLVIEHVSALVANVQGGKVMTLKLCTRSGSSASGLNWHYLILSSPVLTVQHLAGGTDLPIEYLTASQAIRAYADAVNYPVSEFSGAQVIVGAVIFADDAIGYTDIKVTISGYLVPLT